MSVEPPNIVFVFADQMRAQATGYAGDRNVHTPHLDRLAAESVNFSRAISGCPVCCPARATLITSQHPHVHGIFVNDVHLSDDAPSLAHTFAGAGYDTAWIGKWHLNGRGRSAYIPPEDHQGFGFWRARECTHDYWDAFYYDDEPDRKIWRGYDAEAQTRDAQGYLRDRAADGRPFLLMLSWGPPHNPYDTAPGAYKRQYNAEALDLRPNVRPQHVGKAGRTLAGYYAHISALDACLADLLHTLEDLSLADNTIFVFWSDHGDMLGSQGLWGKQCPWDESIRVPLLIRWPRVLGRKGRRIDTPIATIDLMPTLLDLCDIAVPDTAAGKSFAKYVRGQTKQPPVDAALLACYVPFGEWTRDVGGRAYRGLRTCRYTYTRTLAGPWLLYDNEVDPYQQHNLVEDAGHARLRQQLDAQLDAALADANDPFPSPEALIEQWGYTVNEQLTVPYEP